MPESTARTYAIRVKGRLDASWSAWFDGLALALGQDGDGQTITILSGPIADQAALYGILSRIRDLGLPLLEVRQVEDIQKGGTDDHTL